jgi:hypothetical protein
MQKLQVTIKITPLTRQRLEAMKESTGIPYGILIDNMVREYSNNTVTANQINEANGKIKRVLHDNL